jgi:hypothetical protein
MLYKLPQKVKKAICFLKQKAKNFLYIIFTFLSLMTLTHVLTFEITMKCLIFQYLILPISGEKIPFEKGHFSHFREQKPVCWKNGSYFKKTSTLKYIFLDIILHIQQCLKPIIFRKRIY